MPSATVTKDLFGFMRSTLSYLCDETGDQGDSARSAGIKNLIGHEEGDIVDYVRRGCKCVR